MSILRFYLGEKGDSGTNGIDGLSSADVNGFDIEQPLLDSFLDNQLSKNAMIASDRLDPVSFVDRYGRNTWTKKAESTNYVTHSQDFSGWTDFFGRWSIIGTTQDPSGGNNATEINLDVDTDNLVGIGEVLESTVTSPKIIGCISFYIKVISGEVSSMDFGDGSTTHTVETPTGEYTRVIFPFNRSAGVFIFSINPRGKTGARIAIYGVQIEDNPTAKDLITTHGAISTSTFTDNLIRQSDKGILIEDAKANLVHHGNDLSKWTIENGTIAQSPIEDAFNHKYQYTSVVFGSLPNISITASTDALSQGTAYTVSFWAYITGGSMQPITISLGGGADVIFDTASVTGFTRLSAVCIAGGLDELLIKLESQALNANLLISSVQVEVGAISSYKQTSTTGTTNNADNFNMQHTYNFPAPNLKWSIVFGKNELLNNSDIKTIFSNGETTTNEFSLTYQDRNLILNMGGNTVSADLYDYEKVALVFDGSNVKFYGEKTLIATEAIASSTFISSTIYIGHNGTDSALNAYLTNFMAYNVELTLNEIIYMMGA